MERYRETDTQYPQISTHYSKTSAGSATTTVNDTEVAGGLKRIWDCTVRNYREVVQKGWVLLYQPVVIETREVTVTPLVTQATVTTGTGAPWVTSWGDHGSSTVFPYFASISLPPLDNAIVAQVMNSAISKAKMGNWDALTSLAEAHKSVHGIADRMGKTFTLAERYARRAAREKTIGHKIRTFEQLWLEGRYQWRPLVGEVQDITNHLQKGSKAYSRDRSRATESLTVGSYPSDVTSGPRIWSRSSTIVGERSYNGFAFAVGNISSANLSVGQSLWELTPYSFIVDKFVDIGSAINAWSPMLGVDIRASGYSVHESYTMTENVTCFDNPAVSSPQVSTSQGYSRVTKVERYTRTPSGALVPRLYPRLHAADFLDILTLATSRARRVTKLLHY